MKHLYRRFLSVTLFFVCTVFSQQAMANIYTVINNNNSGPGSLAEAITLANADAALDTVEFNIPDGQSCIITATFSYSITQPLFINGYSQPGAAQNEIQSRVIRINIDGAALAEGNPIFNIQSPNVTIAG